MKSDKITVVPKIGKRQKGQKEKGGEDESAYSAEIERDKLIIFPAERLRHRSGESPHEVGCP